MTTEEKAKRYDEAIIQLRTMMPNWEKLSYNGKTFLQDLVYIIPELKESEDERIRKTLKEYFVNSFQDNGVAAICGVHIKDILAWLEKQGEQNLANSCKTCKDEQKPANKVEPKFKVGDIITPKDRGHEPWQIIQVDILDKKYRFKDGYVIRFSQEDDYELVAWSEEDENYLNTTIAYLKDAKEFKKTAENCINWLKSLRPKNTWKPSDGQIKAIRDAIEFLGCTKEVRENLKSLYEQLKKLREK